MKMTSAYANKLLRQLNEEKEFLLIQEENSCTYVYAADEEPLIPQYSYPQTEAQLRALDAKIVKIKHAVNCSNVSTSLTLSSGRVLTVDQALVVMAQLSQRKQQLDILRKRQPKARNNDHYGRSGATEYTCINYDLTDVRKAYEAISAEIMEIQMKLDQLNQTVTFDVEL